MTPDEEARLRSRVEELERREAVRAVPRARERFYFELELADTWNIAEALRLAESVYATLGATERRKRKMAETTKAFDAQRTVGCLREKQAGLSAAATAVARAKIKLAEKR